MAFRDETHLPGGIYWEGDDKLGDRTDVSIEGVGLGREDNPFLINLHITTGNGTYCLCSVTFEDAIRLGKWIVEAVKEKIRESVKEKK